jgi:hypothetical protein
MQDETSEASAVTPVDVGPYLEVKKRYMTGAEVRIFSSHTGISPEAAVSWIEADVGPYDAKRAIDAGQSVSDVLADRARQKELDRARWSSSEISDAATKEWEAIGFDEDEALLARTLSLTPDDLQMWVVAEFGDVREMKNWIDISFRPARAIEWMHQGFGSRDAQEWARGFISGEIRGIVDTELFDDDEDDEEARRVAVAVSFAAEEASEWKSKGFSADEAREWFSLACDPTKAKEKVTAGLSVVTYRESLCDNQPDSVLIWGNRYGRVSMALRSAISSFLSRLRFNDVIHSCDTWELLIERVGADTVTWEFESYVNQAWEELSVSLADKPDGWLPSGRLPNLSEYFSDQQVLESFGYIDDIDGYDQNIPVDIVVIATAESAGFRGELIYWEYSSMDEVARLANQNGLALVRDDALVAACWDRRG